MRKLIFVSKKTVALLLLALGFSAMAARPSLAQRGSLVDVGVDYNYVRSNLLAGGCGCFALNGGSGWMAFNFSRSVGIVGEIASQEASNVSSASADLTLTSFLAGPRFRRTMAGHFGPFVQVSSAEPMRVEAWLRAALGCLDRLTRLP
jgi:outer membrane immunogenic protein